MLPDRVRGKLPWLLQFCYLTFSMQCFSLVKTSQNPPELGKVSLKVQISSDIEAEKGKAWIQEQMSKDSWNTLPPL